MKSLPLINRFTSGEISPRLYSQSDIEEYKSGLEFCENMYPLKHGPVDRRLGSEFIASVELDDIETDVVRIFPFHHRPDLSFVVLVDDNDIRIYDDDGFVAEILTLSPWNNEELPFVQAVLDFSGNRLVFTVGTVAPHDLVYDPVLETFAFDEIIFTNPPVEWANFNFPAVMTWFQGRTWWAATPDAPDRFWGSVVGDYYNLDAQSVDGLTFDLARFGRIRWMAGIRSLIIGTDLGEYLVTGASGFISQGNIRVENQSTYGSEKFHHLDVGNKALYVTSDGAKLRAIDFNEREEAWASRDLIFASEHFREKGRMKYLSYARNPESIIWATTDTGLLFSCTYDPFTGYLGWAHHNTAGTYLDVTSIETNGVSSTWVLVQRNITTPNTVYLERFSKKFYSDSYNIDTYEIPDTGISALHLADQTVTVTVDGAVVPDVLLDASGQGDTIFAGLEIVSGLKYTPTMKTLPLDQGARGGSGMSLKKRFNRIFVRIINSANPLINGERPPSRTPSTPMNTPEPLRTTEIDARDTGWSQTAQITITQDLPLPLTVSGLFGELNQNYIA